MVYGHTPVPLPEWLNNTINLDTGCVFGGSLTALRYPEREVLSVAALQTYAEPVKPLQPATQEAPDLLPSAQQQHDDLLDLPTSSANGSFAPVCFHRSPFEKSRASQPWR